MIGQKFKKVTVLKYVGVNKHGKRKWECKCDCGKEFTTVGSYLLNGDTTSCGCLGKENRIKSRETHGQSHLNMTKEYQIWKAMKKRCINPNATHFKNYGGKGVVVCERWMDFKHFILGMGAMPGDKNSIDRIDNDGNYEPENCRWATNYEQSRNKSNNVWLQWNGQKMILKDWAIRFGVHPSTISEKLKNRDFSIIAENYAKR